MAGGPCPLTPERSDGRRACPLTPERSDGRRTCPLTPERSDGRRACPLTPERSDGRREKSNDTGKRVCIFPTRNASKLWFARRTGCLQRAGERRNKIWGFVLRALCGENRKQRFRQAVFLRINPLKRAQRKPTLLFVLPVFQFRFSANGPSFAPLFQLPPRMKTPLFVDFIPPAFQ